MVKFANMKEEYSTYKIEEDTFIKILSYDKVTNAANVDIFYKVNNKYRAISQYELPNNIVNMIATKKSEAISEEELKNFQQFLEKLSICEKEKNKEIDKIIFGKILHNFYILSKSKLQNFYRISMALPNEFGIMVQTTPVISSLVPYVFADVINMGNKFKNNLFLIDNNLFVQTFEYKNRTLGIIFQFEESENDKAKITFIGIFGLTKNFKGEYEILINPQDLNFITDMKNIVDEQIKIFTKRLELK